MLLLIILFLHGIYLLVLWLLAMEYLNCKAFASSTAGCLVAKIAGTLRTGADDTGWVNGQIHG